MSTPAPNSPRRAGIAFLLAQIGAHGAEKFAERLEPLKVTPAQAGILRAIEGERGISQRRLAGLLGMFPSRLVLVLDAMEKVGLLERKASSGTARTYALHLTARGRNLLREIGTIARDHQDSLCGSLNPEERTVLADLLSRIADDQGLTPGVHPGYKQIGTPAGAD